MPATLDGVRAKFERAHRHIAELRALVQPLTEAAVDSIVREDDSADADR